MNQYKVIFHIDEKPKAELVFKNIKNLIADLGLENLEVEMLANDEAVKLLLKDSEHKQALEELAAQRVIFCACANSLRNFEIKEDQLLGFVNIVSAGVGEIVKKQAAGWLYIRP